MTSTPKKQTSQHIVDREGQHLLQRLLPTEWVLREYHPDYGIDYALEIFNPPGPGKSGGEALGEHLFIQLKSTSKARVRRIPLYGRGSVEKFPGCKGKGALIGHMEVAAHSIDVSELCTVERMGVGVPVLLVLADLSAGQCYFVCLNDYIDKVIVPDAPRFRSLKSCVVHVPVWNRIASEGFGRNALAWYGKRSKLYAAFQRFVYQAAEIFEASSQGNILSCAKHFADRVTRYDFWDEPVPWQPLSSLGLQLRTLRDGGADALVGSLASELGELLESSSRHSRKNSREKEALAAHRIKLLWRQLSNLPCMYEDVCREWYIPTALGLLGSYDENP